MHEDLGVAIEEEGRMAKYTGAQFSEITPFIEHHIDNLWQLGVLTPRGSSRTIRMQTISNS